MCIYGRLHSRIDKAIEMAPKESIEVNEEDMTC